MFDVGSHGGLQGGYLCTQIVRGRLQRLLHVVRNVLNQFRLVYHISVSIRGVGIRGRILVCRVYRLEVFSGITDIVLLIVLIIWRFLSTVEIV